MTARAEPRRLPIPLGAVVDEASFTAALIDALWEPNEERPGLAHAETPRFTRACADRLRALAAELRASRSGRALGTFEEHDALRARARARLRDLASALRFAATLHPIVGVHLARVRAAQGGRPWSALALAGALADHASLAELHLDALGEIPSFDRGWIDDARSLARTLRAVRGRVRDAREAHSHRAARRAELAREALELLVQVRAAGRYVFRDHPELARHFASEHLRQKKRRRRARAA